jgi:hypothetical protein
MKKFFLMAVIALAATTAKAQLWVGGELGYNSSKTKIEQTVYNTTTTQTIADNSGFTFKPELVYDLNDNWSLGFALGFKHSNNSGSVTTNAWSVEPFARYKFAEAGDVKFFLDGGLAYESVHFNSTGADNAEGYGVFVRPGLSYEISDNVCFDAHLGNLSYMFAKHGDEKTNAFELKAASAFTFGVYFKF